MMLSDAIKSFQKSSLKETQTVETTVRSLIGEGDDALQWIRTGSGWRQVEVAQGEDAGRINGDSGKEAAQTTRRMTGVAPHQMHGQCYGIEAGAQCPGRSRLHLLVRRGGSTGYDTMSASEFEDDPAVLKTKVKYLARPIRGQQCASSMLGRGSRPLRASTTMQRGTEAPTRQHCALRCRRAAHAAHRVLVAMPGTRRSCTGSSVESRRARAKGGHAAARQRDPWRLHAPDNPCRPHVGHAARGPPRRRRGVRGDERPRAGRGHEPRGDER